MSLTFGTKLGPYEILAPIGAGGMGEVYRARDTKLGRDVALKVLPEAFAHDSDRMARFEREAQVLASLNHPNIAAIYGLEESGGIRALVMELVEGPTLAERIRGRAMPLEDALPIAKQIAEALEYAHERGIIHRDLKPANVKLTADGNVKVLDFGLAKALEAPGQAAGNPSISPTLTIEGTRAGVILGTAAYMAPEQARGGALDKRADIWSFGVVLYEMLTGQQPFAGATVSDTLAAVLKEEPDVRQVPAQAQKLLRRCLDKDPKRRLRDIGEARFLLEEAPPQAAPAPTSSQWWKIVAGAMTVAFVLALWVAWRATRPVSRPRVLGSTQITRDGHQKISQFGFQSLWTDGSRLYFNEGANGSWGVAQVSALGGETLPFPTSISTPLLLSLAQNRSELLVQSLRSNEQRSPLWAVPILGGTPRRLGGVRANDGAYSPDGRHIVYVEGSDIYQINLDGTGSRKLVTVSGVAVYPRFSPDGSILRFTVIDNTSSYSIWEVRSDGRGLHPILPDWNKPHLEQCGSWTPDGRYYIFEAVRAGTGNSNLWALREKGGLLGGPSREPVQLTSGPLDFHMPVPDPNGRRLDVFGVQQRGELIRYDAKSRQFQSFLSAIGAEQLDFSKDGLWVAYVLYPEGSLWRSKLDGSERLQLTFPPAQVLTPRWSPDGKRIAFSIRTPGKPQKIYSLAVDGGAPEQLTTGDKADLETGWSKDGESLVFGDDGPNNEAKSTSLTIKVLNLKTRQVSILPGSEGLWHPGISPDGRHILALTANSQAIMLFDVATQKWTELARTAVNSPAWSHDGQYIYFDSYPTRDAAIFRVRINDHKLERVANLEGLRRADSSVLTWPWMGLTPDDSPILLRDLGTQEIYALDLQLP